LSTAQSPSMLGFEVWTDQDETESPQVPVVTLRTEVGVSQSAAVDTSWGIDLDDDIVVPAASEPVPDPIRSVTHLIGGEWDWKALRDYVMTESETRHGKFPRDPVREAAIFRSFIERHGPTNAEMIARAAFEIHNGMWRGAPIRASRFAKSSDPFFAAYILAK
jgi:hypothetical protein